MNSPGKHGEFSRGWRIVLLALAGAATTASVTLLAWNPPARAGTERNHAKSSQNWQMCSINGLPQGRLAVGTRPPWRAAQHRCTRCPYERRNRTAPAPMIAVIMRATRRGRLRRSVEPGTSCSLST